ncbi:DHRS4 family protein [Megaselia abdita]
MLSGKVPLSVNLCRKISTSSRNMGKLDGKVAVVTASTDGIGFAIAKRLLEDGAKVVISSRKEANVQKALNELKKHNLNAHGIKCHVGNKEDRQKLFDETIKQYGKLNILVSNAATNPAVGGVLDCDESVWDKIFDTNVKASFMLAKEALPFLRKSNSTPEDKHSNSIVFVSSIAGYDAFELLGAYSVSKTALIGLSRAAAKDLAPEGIRVNCLAPGIIKTNFSKAVSF